MFTFGCQTKGIIPFGHIFLCSDVCLVSYSGKRTVTIVGTHLDSVEGVSHGHAPQQVILPRNSSSQTLVYETPAAENAQSSFVFFKVANQTLTCSTKFTYSPDPQFTGFTAVRVGNNVRVVLQKTVDNLEMKMSELSVWGVQEEERPCVLKERESSDEDEAFICDITGIHSTAFKELKIKYGGRTVRLRTLSLIQILRLLLIPVVIAVLGIICGWERRLTAETNEP